MGVLKTWVYVSGRVGFGFVFCVAFVLFCGCAKLGRRSMKCNKGVTCDGCVCYWILGFSIEGNLFVTCVLWVCLFMD